MKNNSHNLKEKKKTSTDTSNVKTFELLIARSFLHLRLSWVLLFHNFSIMVKDKSIKTTTLTDG